MMRREQLYIDGEWVEATGEGVIEVTNPATEEIIGSVPVGSSDDVDAAVSAARAAFTDWSQSSVEDRMAVLNGISGALKEHTEALAQCITAEVGTPIGYSRMAMVGTPRVVTRSYAKMLESFEWEEEVRNSLIVKEPIGVCAFITPWNFPLHQIIGKVAPALAAGCTMVLKPSEVAPFSGYIWTEILDAAGVPAGVFNMVNGDGPTVGHAISSHPEVDMVSITGSTRAGIEVARAAAATVKRVAQELGGKSPNIILEDADLAAAVASGVASMMRNSGQSCNAPSRMFVPAERMDEAIAIAKAAAESITVGDPRGDAQMGPVVSETQWKKIQGLIQKGIAEGATLVTGGVGRPDGLDKGYYVKPTVFAHVTNDMTIAREEIFGPVVSILGYDTLDQAIEVGNDTPYGLAAYVQGTDLDKVRDVARQLRAGQVTVNGAGPDMMAPFGGFKQSGNGREWGDHAFGEFLETKAIIGYGA